MFVEQPLALPRSAKYQVKNFPNFGLQSLTANYTKEAKLSGCLRETSDDVIITCQGKKSVCINRIILKV